MDLLGDIVEKLTDSLEGTASDFKLPVQNTRFNRKPSRWKDRLKTKNIDSLSFTKNSNVDSEIKQLETSGDELTEKEKIHLENLKYFASLSPEQLAHEKEELMESINPDLLNALMRKAAKSDKYLAEEQDENKYYQPEKEKYSKSILAHASESSVPDKFDTVNANMKKKVCFKEDEVSKHTGFPNINLEIKPDERIPTLEELNQLNNLSLHDLFADVHFPKNPKPKDNEDIKINLDDPDFLEKMHEKYFAELPKETEKLKWMEPVDPIASDIILNLDELRFDFKGNIITPDPIIVDKIPTSSGLYHHSENPELPGYTLKELSNLSRSKLSAQRCISIRTIGRILHKLGLHKFDIEDETEKKTVLDIELKTEFEVKLWKQIIKLKIISTLLSAADEMLTRNISVRNYAIDALWLFKKTGAEELVKEIEISMIQDDNSIN